MKKITFVLPSRNNLEFLKLAYNNLKKLSNGLHNILVLDDASTDGTKEWLDSLQDPNLIIHSNPGPERIGIVGMFDKGIELSNTEIIMAFHADMVPSPNMDINILKHLKPMTVVSATRVEPPLHPAGPEKITIDFGDEVEKFREKDWNAWALENETVNKDKTTEGIFAPWCMYKEDFFAVGGHDSLFAPQSKEDSDLFNRFVLNGYKVIQSWDALAYHFTSRGSRFNKHAGGAAGVNSTEWINTNNKNLKNFIRKWGSFVKHDSMMKPIITPLYDIGFRVRNIDIQKLAILEPLCSNIGIENRFELQNEYIKIEQPHTSYNLSDKISDYEYNGFKPLKNEIIIEFDVNRMNEQSFNMLLQIPDIINQSGSQGEFELDIFKVTIKDMKRYEDSLIKVSK
jgi:glycosyltransferase involved in cell wall biosynthesis